MRFWWRRGVEEVKYKTKWNSKNCTKKKNNNYNILQLETETFTFFKNLNHKMQNERKLQQQQCTISREYSKASNAETSTNKTLCKQYQMK